MILIKVLEVLRLAPRRMYKERNDPEIRNRSTIEAWKEEKENYGGNREDSTEVN